MLRGDELFEVVVDTLKAKGGRKDVSMLVYIFLAWTTSVCSSLQFALCS